VRVSGTAAICHGSISRPLGQLAATATDWTNAEQHFEAALAQNTAIGCRPELALTQLDYAHMLARRAQTHDHAHARELLDAALTSARDLGMTALENSSSALIETLAPRISTRR
jgi:uncharacterized protein HemY